MNISLTAINTVLSIVTLPLIANWAINTLANTGQVVPLQFGKVVEVNAIVLLPVAAGMWVRTLKPRFAARAEKPMKIICSWRYPRQFTRSACISRLRCLGFWC